MPGECEVFKVVRAAVLKCMYISHSKAMARHFFVVFVNYGTLYHYNTAVSKSIEHYMHTQQYSLHLWHH